MAVMTSVSNASLSPLNAFYDRVPLKRLVAKTVYYQLGYKKSLEKNHGRTYTFNVGQVQPAITSALAEGVPVVPSSATSTPIVIQVQEYGNAFAASSLLNGTDVVNTEKFIEEQVEQQGAYSLDAVIRNSIFNTANVFGVNQYASNFKTSINNIVAADVLTTADIRLMHSTLEVNNVPTFPGGKYVSVIHAASWYDMGNSNTGGGYLDLAKQNPAGLEGIKKAQAISENGELDYAGELVGQVIFKTSLNPVVNNSGGVPVFYSAHFGDMSLGCVPLDGQERFKVYRKGAGDTGTYDILEMIPLAMGYKFTFGSANLSQDLATASLQRVLTLGSASVI